MTVYKIVSRGKDRKGKLIERTEYIDSTKNYLFRASENPEQVKTKYNQFWGGEAKAIDVKKVNVKSRGENWGIKIKKLKEMS